MSHSSRYKFSFNGATISKDVRERVLIVLSVLVQNFIVTNLV